MSKQPTNVVTESLKKKSGKKGDGIITLASGIRVRLLPVPAGTITELQGSVKKPKVPTIPHPSADLAKEGHTIEHPDSPQYKQDMLEYNEKVSEVGMKALTMLGVELVDGVPEDDRWIKELKFIGIDVGDIEDEIELEFSFKKYKVVDSDMIMAISSLSGVSAADIEAAKDSFPS